MQALITGVNGFVGKYLAKELQEKGYSVSGIGMGQFDLPDVQYKEVNITDQIALERAMKELRPDMIFHLAGVASVGHSWLDPKASFEVNVIGTINLLESLKGQDVRAIINVSSSELYGPGRRLGERFSESMPPNPQSPYATSKYASERISLQLGQMYKLPVIVTRPFNHIGIGQNEGFVVPDFARQIIEASKRDESIRVGRLDVYRDFTDVRDIVRAYRLLAEKGQQGETYNICSGEAKKISDILDLMRAERGNLSVELDESKLRPVENIYSVGDNNKIRTAVTWEPIYSIEDSLKGVLAEWENRL
ncbi:MULTISPECIES: GDP-mannose 4,6-dehydratase [Desulfosporosinus]|uniref:Nucleoside-diphosphate-sugar epimerase n=1 Tax=Desulfosporosinus lacus DSM 15449 TaxID=1121420 RepID=A0A1M5RX10_9FIRM|nr:MULTISPECIES: GDP-mannose 4,6-dehydratase [Desulfosporosinus]MDA8221052.1 GDP-mannose 4,6-dehydratase [Desulfitobacterium hafniense]SHH30882.1 Nucleoside-diphosphate-sugar epimerase [Desulfosporosinus lacus DSM 15449]